MALFKDALNLTAGASGLQVDVTDASIMFPSYVEADGAWHITVMLAAGPRYDLADGYATAEEAEAAITALKVEIGGA